MKQLKDKVKELNNLKKNKISFLEDFSLFLFHTLITRPKNLFFIFYFFIERPLNNKKFKNSFGWPIFQTSP
jgi:hypothetical protein